MKELHWVLMGRQKAKGRKAKRAAPLRDGLRALPISYNISIEIEITVDINRATAIELVNKG
jgi:hypothetical protein